MKLDVARFNKFSGLSLKASKAILILKNLSFKVHARNEKKMSHLKFLATDLIFP